MELMDNSGKGVKAAMLTPPAPNIVLSTDLEITDTSDTIEGMYIIEVAVGLG